MLLEARWLWDGDLLGVEQVAARGVVRLADFGLPRLEQERVVVFAGGRLVYPALHLERLTVRFSLVEDAPRFASAPLGELRVTKGVALAAVLHATLFAMAFIGRAAPHEEEASRFEVMKALVSALDAREAGDLHTEEPPAPARDELSIAKKDEPGISGNPISAKTNGRAARAKGAEDPEATREQERREAREFGMIGLLAPSDAARSGGSDPFGSYEGPSAVGSIFGTQVDDAFGFGGAALSGTGSGGGGKGAGIEQRGAAAAAGFGSGCGCGTGRLGGFHQTRAPVLRCDYDEVTKQETCATQVRGHLPPEIVQRVVRQNFGRMRMCYEAGLTRTPSLEGRISVKFVIDRTGSVAMVSTTERSLPDSDVASCVERAFKAMSFPEPEGGIVTVIYPLVLST